MSLWQCKLHFSWNKACHFIWTIKVSLARSSMVQWKRAENLSSIVQNTKLIWLNAFDLINLKKKNMQLNVSKIFCYIATDKTFFSTKSCRPRWLSWMRRPTGDQEVAGSTPAEVGNILSWRLIMKYFLRSFSPFRWFKKGSCQFLAKECAQYWLTA